MAKSIAVLDSWAVMTVMSFFTAVGLLSGQGLLRGRGSGSWANVILCFAEAALGFALFVSLKSRRRGFWMRLAMVVVAAVVLWFQPTPWLGLNDSALVHRSFEQEFMRQRLVQFSAFGLSVVPFVGLGIARWKMESRQPLGDRRGSGAPSVPLIVIAFVALACGLTSRLIDGSPHGLAIQAVILAAVTLLVLLELARRAVRADQGVRVALAAVAIGMPLLSFWR